MATEAHRIRRKLRDWRWTVTVSALVIVGILVFGYARQEDAIKRSNVAADAATRLSVSLQQVVANLEAETRARTTESCNNSAKGRQDLVNAFVGTFDSINQELQAAGRPPSVFFENQIAAIKEKFPPLTCPQDQGPIVIPQPSSTLPGQPGTSTP